ncbi:35817_t:CDS:2, partial [Racocetra persica]
AESKHFCFWYLVGKWNLKKIAKEEFASSSHHLINASLRSNNEFNKFIEVISSDLKQLPEN